MDKNLFYNHVSSWIDSYHNAAALDWLRRFINNSHQPQEVKDRLNREVDRKIASLTGAPYFSEYEGMNLLMDEHCRPQIFTTRYQAMSKVAQLRIMGYDARILEGNAFYRIQLATTLPVPFTEPINQSQNI